jgi:hypothetical protein
VRGAFRVSSRGGDESAYREPPRVQNPVRYAEVPTPYSKTSHTVHDPHRADVIMARTWSRGGGRVLDAWQHIVQLSQPRAAPQCGDYHTFGCTRLPVCFYIELGECVCPVGAWACGIHICDMPPDAHAPWPHGRWGRKGTAPRATKGMRFQVRLRACGGSAL